MEILNKVKIMRKKISKVNDAFFLANSCKKAEYIIVDTPVHGNLGDHAIALAQEQFLNDTCSKSKITEISAIQIHKMEKVYARIVPKGAKILVHGGGFLGSLWPEEEYRFRRIIKSFNNHEIIVFPQTITFDMETPEQIKFFNESHGAYASHKRLTICVREMKSYNFMKKNMPEVKCILVPDIVTQLKYETVKTKRSGVLMCMRSDKEKSLSEESYSRICASLKKKFSENDIEFTDTVTDYHIQTKDRKEEVDAKLEQFSKAKLIITDRLHGMIFAAITHTPCIALGNCNGKVKGVYQWIKNNSFIHYLDNPEDFEKILNLVELEGEHNYNMEQIVTEFKGLEELLL